MSAFQVGHKQSRGRRVIKLSDTSVREIYRSKLPLAELAERFDVTVANVSMIKRGRSKRAVTGAPMPPPPYLRGIKLELYRLNALSNALKHLEAVGILLPEVSSF